MSLMRLSINWESFSFLSLCVCVCVCACVHACMRACVGACVCVCDFLAIQTQLFVMPFSVLSLFAT